MNEQSGMNALDLASIFEEQVGPVFGYVLTRCGSRSVAEDLTAETFAAATKQFERGRGQEVTRAWLFTVAKRRLVDHWRATSRNSRRLGRLAELRQSNDPPDTDPDGLVDTALNTLPDRQRAALTLRYLDGFSTSEVADILDVSYKAAESLLARARRSFAQAYEGES